MRPPAATLAAVTPHLGSFGITRVANVTGLDRVGIPVWQAIRPNGRSLAVSQGKGLDHEAAKVSAIMESIETWHAEFALPPARMESFAALSTDGPVLDPDALPRGFGSQYRPDRIIPWVEGDDLLGGGRVWVPFEPVHVMFVVPEPPGSGCFLRSSNGLASGNTRTEALVHALAEVIERDGVATGAAMSAGALARRRVDLTTVDDPAAAALLARLDEADIAVAVHDLTTPAGIPIFRATIFDRASDDLVNPTPAAAGGGCHPDPGIALCRALTEAAQSRLTFIAGTRDDLTREHYRRAQSRRTLTLLRRFVTESGRGRVRFRDVAGCATPTTGGDLVALLAGLARTGIEQVAAVTLDTRGLPFSVVRVVVPGLEGYLYARGYVRGVRRPRRSGRHGARRS